MARASRLSSGRRQGPGGALTWSQVLRLGLAAQGLSFPLCSLDGNSGTSLPGGTGGMVRWKRTFCCLWLTGLLLLLGCLGPSQPQASSPALSWVALRAWHPHPSAAGLAKPRVPDARNSQGNPNRPEPQQQVPPHPQGEGLQFQKLPGAQLEKGLHLSTKAAQAPVPRTESSQVSTSHQSMIRSGIFCSRTCVHVDPAASPGAFLNAMRGAVVDHGRESDACCSGLPRWAWLVRAGCGALWGIPGLLPETWDSSGGLSRVQGGGEHCAPSQLLP